MQNNKQEIREHLTALNAALDQDDQDAIAESLKALARVHDRDMFQELGRMTRDLHQSIQELSFDPGLKDLAENELPDAKARLQHVIDMTEKAAHRTMNAVELLIPLQDPAIQEAEVLLDAWSKLYSREMAPQDFAGFAQGMQSYLERARQDSEFTRTHLTEIMMAQEYQDLSSQIIRRVIQLVQTVEEQLVHLVQAFALKSNRETPERQGEKLEGPQIDPKSRTDVVSSQDEVDELLSSLGF
ncbi:protein phosphatase CheZ [Thermithiobacillus plumbiphilus]|uniref:Protein phosphatase CheZ n=1 Tax=Thermithiobacillus plumbiphilus TaxID=1729899 RepID=A0ABU9DAI5_9PROT